MTHDLFLAGLFAISAAIELLLVILEGTFPKAIKGLPLGGSHLAQVGILFGLAWVVHELATTIAHAFPATGG